jgi:type 2 lantibiotic biosynthesis protein LanM
MLDPLNDWMAGVAATSATLSERLAGAAEPLISAESSDQAAALRAEWLGIAARGDEALFARRLAWDGWDERAVAPMIGKVVAPSGGQPPPEWTGVLRDALAAGLDDPSCAWIENPALRPACFVPTEPMAFEDAFVPFIRAARSRAQERVGEAAGLLAPEAWTSLERNLLAYLTRRAERALYLEFSIEREASKIVSQSDESSEDPVAGGRTHYAAFIRGMYAERRILEFLGEYCVLARQLGTLMTLWVEAIAEFVGHLEADLEVLGREFCGGRAPGQVVALQPFLSDRHFKGRGVMILHFAEGVRVVYKPKTLSAEVSYYGLLEWFNRNGPPLPFKILNVLDRGTHGWVEHVGNLPCADEDAVRRYYRRSGMFLALAYALEATDCHYENMIACGEHPVLIDLETLMHGRPRPDAGQVEGAHELASRRMQDSVLRTAFLPRWEFGPNGESYDISGLGGGAGMVTPFLAGAWKEINTDAMTLTQEPLKTLGNTNQPRLGGEPVGYAAYRTDMLEGFEGMYRYLASRSAEMLAPDGPIAQCGLGRQRLRFLLRHTKVYFSMLKSSTHPNRLRDGAQAAVHFDLLARAFLNSDQPPLVWPVVERETSEMMYLDVPYFFTHADSCDLHLGIGGPVVHGYLAVSGYDAMRKRLATLDLKDLDAQLLFIKSALFAREALSHQSAGLPSRDAVAAPESAPALSQRDCLGIALEIGRSLADRAVRSESNRSATWVSFEYMEQAGRHELLPMGYRMYEGVTGVALFLGALAAETGDGDFRYLAEAALFSLRRALREAPQKVTAEIGIGAGMGIGSVAYALVRLAGYLDMPDLLDDARLAVAQINPETVGRDRRHDLLFGASGAILALLAAPQLEAPAAARARIAVCGEHLLAGRVATPGGRRAWPTGDGGAALTGFSHGAAGIAYALARAAAVAQRSDFLDAAREAVAYEDSQFDAGWGNWLDHREVPAGGIGMPICSWCHGAPGILLGRAAGLAWLDGQEVRGDLERAAAATMAHPLEFLDQLCCGNLGRAEILIVAGRLSGRPDWTEHGRQISDRIAARAGQAGGYGVNWRGGPFHAGFFQGISGIGYHYLQRARPEQHPSALYWQ